MSRNVHPLVAATQRFHADLKPDDDGRMRPGPKEGVAHLIVSKAVLRRALLYLQAIFAEAERRAYVVAPSRGYESTGVAVVVHGHLYPVSIHELHGASRSRPPTSRNGIAGGTGSCAGTLISSRRS